MLRSGPPQIVTVSEPFMENAPARVGWRMMIGTGLTLSTIAATPMALAVEVDDPRSCMSPVVNVRVMVTWIALAVFAGSGDADKATPGNEVGKLIATVSEAVLPKPL